MHHVRHGDFDAGIQPQPAGCAGEANCEMVSFRVLVTHLVRMYVFSILLFLQACCNRIDTHALSYTNNERETLGNQQGIETDGALSTRFALGTLSQ